MNLLALLDELRIIAGNGLEYAEDPYDRQRYERLQELVERYYGDALDLPPATVRDRLAAEFGHRTPKVGAEAAILDEEGRILLMKRSDDRTWCLPGGYVGPGESPDQTVVRETREETGLDTELTSLLGLYTRKPGEYGPHSLVSPLYLCKVVGGDRELSREGEAIRYWELGDVPSWHKDHQRRARDARERWESQ